MKIYRANVTLMSLSEVVAFICIVGALLIISNFLVRVLISLIRAIERAVQFMIVLAILFVIIVDNNIWAEIHLSFINFLTILLDTLNGLY